ncbi:gamma-butyrobetaine dioxygenase-like [Lineus longissimus]|uniref:gamma-butyrobetaine dioxygenase-like n=1 Tax=Lineus longissimus TaxID=88925 RepID=UPI002B4DCF92
MMANRGLKFLRGGVRLANTARELERHATKGLKILLSHRFDACASARLFHQPKRFQHVQSTEILCDGIQVQSVEMDAKNYQLAVRMSDGKTHRFPNVYLRDHCPCPICWNELSQTTQRSILDQEVNIQPANVKVAPDGNAIAVTWPDGHVSPYGGDWLHERSFHEDVREKRLQNIREKHQFWGRERQDDLGNFEWDELISNDGAFLNWLLDIKKYGLVLIKNAPSELEAINMIGAKVAHFRQNHHGATYTVRNKNDSNTSDLAYTSVELELHADLVYYDHVPGILLLHCLDNTATGGEGTYSDASYAAMQLKRLRPDMFKVLTETLVDFKDVCDEHVVYRADKRSRHPVIKLDENGDVAAVHFNHCALDSLMTIPLDKVKLWYEAFRMLADILVKPENLVQYRLRKGDIIAFDNYKVLHGRRKIESDGERYLHGAVLDWDTVNSRIRVLRKELGIKEQ